MRKCLKHPFLLTILSLPFDFCCVYHNQSAFLLGQRDLSSGGEGSNPRLSLNQSACLRQLCSRERSSCGFANQAWSLWWQLLRFLVAQRLSQRVSSLRAAGRSRGLISVVLHGWFCISAQITNFLFSRQENTPASHPFSQHPLELFADVFIGLGYLDQDWEGGTL